MRMSLLLKFEKFFLEVKQNRWVLWFSYFNRILLAFGFIAAGYTKIIDERFASGLSMVHPMGTYLAALWHTGYYYTFIGVGQIVAGVLLLIPRTVTLGALLYFPIIVNILILSYAVRFEGSWLTAPLMVLSNVFLLCWNYDRLKFILPFKNLAPVPLPRPIAYSKKFPWKFFFGATIAFLLTVSGAIAMNVFAIMPRNHIGDCTDQFKGTNRTTAGAQFCDCVHNVGKPLDSCLETYEKAANDSRK